MVFITISLDRSDSHTGARTLFASSCVAPWPINGASWSRGAARVRHRGPDKTTKLAATQQRLNCSVCTARELSV